MYFLGDVFLSCSAFAQYQYAHVGRGDQPYLAVYLPESRALPLMDGRIVPLHPFPQGFQEREEVGFNQLFRDVVLRALLHRPDGGGHLVIVGHDDVGIVPALFPQFFQQTDTVTVIQAQVSQNDVIFPHLGKQHPCAVAGGGADAWVSLAFQQAAYKVGIDDVVLHYDYPSHLSASFLAVSTMMTPCSSTPFTADCISSSDMFSLWMASYNTANGCAAFISIHELLR